MAMAKNKKILLLIFLVFFMISGVIFFLAVHTKTKFAREAIAKIEKKGGTVVTDGSYHSRGFISDSVNSLVETFGYDAELGHRAFTVTLNEKFENEDMILVNAVPHVQTLNIHSSHITNEALLNIHGSDLLHHMTLENLKCDKDGLKQLSKFKQLKSLTVIKLEYVTEDDFAFVSKLKLEMLTIRNMNVVPLHFTEKNQVPPMTKLFIK